MKLTELAREYNLLPDLLREVVETDLSIPLPKGFETPLSDKEIQRILACDGLETVDGQEFKPIIAKEFEEKHKRSLAARKGAETRKRKLAEEAEAHKVAEDLRIGGERRKHADELARREVERVLREAKEAQLAEQRAEIEAIAKTEMEAVRTSAEEEIRRRDLEARRIAAEFAATRRGETTPVAAAAAAHVEAVHAPVSPAVSREPVAAVPSPAPTLVPAAHEAPVAPAAPATTPVSAIPVPAPTVEEAAVTPEAAGLKDALGKSTKGLGSKLASLAKATHEKADHSIKAVPKVISPVGLGGAAPSGSEEALSPDERRRLIQENIRKNLLMQDKVKQAKLAERARRKPGFAPIDRSKTPGGPGASRGPGRGPAAPGGPGPRGPGAKTGRGPKRDSKEHRAEKDATTEGADRAGPRRRLLSTEEQDLSGKTEFSIALPCTVREFSETSGIKASTVIAKLFMAGILANINSVLEKDAVELLAQEFKKTVTITEAKDVTEEVVVEEEIEDKPEDLAPRPPVVTVMGHVDHGKTSLLDAVRKTHMAAGEAGGITQHIGAYTVATPNGMEVTFIDTPGHQAFTEMRARGAQVTDVALIVVAADDGVMPQTIEAINHAKAAGVAVVVAMNKIDKETADPDRVLRQLGDAGLMCEEWGGDIAVMRVSASTGVGLDALLDRLALESEILELTSNHFTSASGTVIEARRSEGRGVTATLLVRRGSLALGDILLAGVGYGRVRNMTDWRGERMPLAGPSHAVEIIGLSDLPRAGDRFQVVPDLKQAAEIAEARQSAQRERELMARSKTTTAATIFGDIAHSKKKEVRAVLKADASGSLEVLLKTIPELSTDEVRMAVIHGAVGGVNSGDISLAQASDALVLGFHVVADFKARSLADQNGIEIRTYTIIYDLLDDLKKIMSGMLEPEVVERVIGHAEVRNTFDTSKVGMVAGIYITDGRVQREAWMRISRDSVIIHTGKVGSLRRFKDDVREVKDGYECGMTVEGFQDLQVKDIMEFYIQEKVARSI